MPHLKSSEAQKNFIKKQLRKASKKDIERIYRYTEYITNFYKKKK
ncbi:MAG: hypothetical protein ACOC56_01910 [Atribacterota bacterium]